MNDKINKMKVMFAQGERELASVEPHLSEGNHGKVRTICRRAAGFYLGGLLEVFPKKNYGMSFMNNLRGLQNDADVPDSVRQNAEKLITHTNNFQLNGKEAVECAIIIIEYCKEKAASVLN